MLRLLLTVLFFLLYNSYSLGKLSDMYLDVLANAHILFALDVPNYTFYMASNQALSSSYLNAFLFLSLLSDRFLSVQPVPKGHGLRRFVRA